MSEQHDKDLVKGKKYCLRLLALGARTEQEIRGRLEAKGYGASERAKIIGAFAAEGLIDDVKFAREWVDRRITSSPRSAKVIRQELCDKGVSPEVTDNALSEREKELDDRKVAKELLEKKLADNDMPDDVKGKSRLYRYLLSKGIDPDVAEELIQAAD